MTSRGSGGVKLAATIATVSAALWFLHPWTVRPIDGVSANGGDPAARVDRDWSSTVRPALMASAVDVRAVVDALRASPGSARARFGRADGAGGWYVVVRGTGRVLSIDRISAAGVARIDLAPYDDREDLSLQVGPVIRGSALRDATDLVPFNNFPNQLAYADAANALNARAFRDVLERAVSTLGPGQLVTFVAAGTTDAPEGSQLAGLVPIDLSVEGRGRE